jgi:hypothetical protein
MSSPVSYDLQGQGGGVVLSATGSDEAVNVRWVQCLTDCVFSAFFSSNLTGAGAIENITIPAGTGIGGRIESVTISSGVAIAYYL